MEEELQITSGTIRCNRDIHLNERSNYLLQHIATSSLSYHIRHLTLEAFESTCYGRVYEMLVSLQRVVDKIGPRLTCLPLVLDDWPASQKSG
jgi:hypothetical protein